MDPFYRLMRLQFWFLVGLLIGFFSVSSFADELIDPQVAYYSTVGKTADSALSACQLVNSAYLYNPLYNQTPFTDGAVVGNCEYPAGSYKSSVYINYKCNVGSKVTVNARLYCSVPACVAPQVRQPDGTCAVTCTAPQIAFPDGSCHLPCGTEFPAGSPPPVDTRQTGALPRPSSFCIGGCAWKPVACVSDATTYACNYVSAGSSCSPNTTSTPVSPKPSPDVPPTPEGCLAQGQSYITMSGSTVCVARSETGAAPTTTDTTKSSSGTGTPPVTTDTKTTVNGDDTITSTTTTTTTNADGSQTIGTTTTTENTSSFCKDNPESEICLKGKWGGSCGAFSCEGDAVQCATAQAVWKSQCDFEKMNEPSTLSDLGNAAANGTDTSLQDLTSGTVVDVQAAFNASQGRWLSGSLPPVSFTALGSSYTLDTSLLAQFMQAIGYILVSIAGVVGIRIIGGQQT